MIIVILFLFSNKLQRNLAASPSSLAILAMIATMVRQMRLHNNLQVLYFAFCWSSKGPLRTYSIRCCNTSAALLFISASPLQIPVDPLQKFAGPLPNQAGLLQKFAGSLPNLAGLLLNLVGLLQISAGLHEDGWVSGSATEFQRVRLKVGGSAGR